MNTTRNTRTSRLMSIPSFGRSLPFPAKTIPPMPPLSNTWTPRPSFNLKPAVSLPGSFIQAWPARGAEHDGRRLTPRGVLPV